MGLHRFGACGKLSWFFDCLALLGMMLEMCRFKAVGIVPSVDASESRPHWSKVQQLVDSVWTQAHVTASPAGRKVIHLNELQVSRAFVIYDQGIYYNISLSVMLACCTHPHDDHMGRSNLTKAVFSLHHLMLPYHTETWDSLYHNSTMPRRVQGSATADVEAWCTSYKRQRQSGHQRMMA